MRRFASSAKDNWAEASASSPDKAVESRWPRDSGERILLEQSGDHCGVEIRANRRNFLILKEDDPTITIVESHAVRSRCQGLKLDDGFIVFDREIFNMELSPMWKHSAKFGESAGNEIRVAEIFSCQRMRPYDRPLYVVCDIVKEGGTVALLEAFEDLTNIIGCDGQSSLARSLWLNAVRFDTSRTPADRHFRSAGAYRPPQLSAESMTASAKACGAS